MRILKFFGAFLITTILIFGFVLGWNWNAFTIFLDNREALTEGNEWIAKTHSLRGLSEFMGENPRFASVASRVIEQPDSAIFLEENSPRIMGTTANIFILAAYAIELDRGTKQGDEQLNLDEISRYKLSNIEESVHREAFKEADRRGWIEENSISLINALKLLAEFNDFALADFLWWHADEAIWTELSEMPEISQSDMPLPFSGLHLAISPQFWDMEFDLLMSHWQQADTAEWRAHVVTLSRRYLNDDESRAEFQQVLNRNRLGTTFMQERDALTLFPKTTANEMAILLERIWHDEFVNRQVSSLIKDFMRWPMDSQPRIETDFSDYGAIYDNRMGLMNGINFGTSTYTGDTTVQALFLDQLPVGFWFHASGGHMHQDFMQRLIYDPALIEQMKRMVKP